MFPYRTAQDHVLNIGRTLEAQVSAYDDQRALITSVQQLVRQFIDEKETLIDAVKAEHPDEARLYIEEGKGRTLMLKIRQDMGRFEHLAQTALNTKLAKLAQDRDTMLMTILGGGLFALICMVAALHLIAPSLTTPLGRLAPPVVAAGVLRALFVGLGAGPLHDDPTLAKGVKESVKLGVWRGGQRLGGHQGMAPVVGLIAGDGLARVGGGNGDGGLAVRGVEIRAGGGGDGRHGPPDRRHRRHAVGRPGRLHALVGPVCRSPRCGRRRHPDRRFRSCAAPIRCSPKSEGKRS